MPPPRSSGSAEALASLGASAGQTWADGDLHGWGPPRDLSEHVLCVAALEVEAFLLARELLDSHILLAVAQLFELRLPAAAEIRRLGRPLLREALCYAGALGSAAPRRAPIRWSQHGLSATPPPPHASLPPILFPPATR